MSTDYIDPDDDTDADPTDIFAGTTVHMNPSRAPFSDTQFAYFTESLARLNNAGPEIYNHFAQHRRAILNWLSEYGAAVMHDQSFTCDACATNNHANCPRDYCQCVTTPECGIDVGPACSICGLRDNKQVGDYTNMVASCTDCGMLVCGDCYDTRHRDPGEQDWGDLGKGCVS